MGEGHDVGAAVSGGRRNVHRRSFARVTVSSQVESVHPNNRVPAMVTDSPYKQQSTMAKFGKFGVWSAAVRRVRRAPAVTRCCLVPLQWVGGVTQSVARALGAEKCAHECPNGKGAS